MQPRPSKIDAILWVMVAVIVVVGIGTISFIRFQMTQTKAAWGVGVVALKGGTLDAIAAAQDVKSYQQYYDLGSIRSDRGVARMYESGRMFLIDRGTKARVLQRGPTVKLFGDQIELVQVHLLDGRHRGKSCWVHPHELLREDGLPWDDEGRAAVLAPEAIPLRATGTEDSRS